MQIISFTAFRSHLLPTSDFAELKVFLNLLLYYKLIDNNCYKEIECSLLFLLTPGNSKPTRFYYQ